MNDDSIWNDIWQADMETNGLVPLIKEISENEKNDVDGYIIVNLNPIDDMKKSDNKTKNEIKVLEEVKIPEKKEHSYKLIEKLFNNYFANRKFKEITNPEEEKEINDFITFAINTKPMKIARKYLEDKNIINSSTSEKEWISYLYKVWFHTYYKNSTCAFEHIFCGEQGVSKRSKLDGHHFWYNYYLNDGPYERLDLEDNIYFIKYVEINKSETDNRAEVITIKYTYKISDESMSPEKLLYKDIGGFFVGISAEGLLALGTVANIDQRTSIPMTINGEEYELQNFDTKDKKGFRTFYPKLKNPISVGK